jgi:hypothetical protein
LESCHSTLESAVYLVVLIVMTYIIYMLGISLRADFQVQKRGVRGTTQTQQSSKRQYTDVGARPSFY